MSAHTTRPHPKTKRHSTPLAFHLTSTNTCEIHCGEVHGAHGTVSVFVVCDVLYCGATVVLCTVVWYRVCCEVRGINVELVCDVCCEKMMCMWVCHRPSPMHTQEMCVRSLLASICVSWRSNMVKQWRVETHCGHTAHASGALCCHSHHPNKRQQS